MGAEKFGWSKRTPEVGSMKRGDVILGWGVAAASWGAGRGRVHDQCHAEPGRNGSRELRNAGSGNRNVHVFAMVVSEKTGIPLEKIHVVIGDSSLAPGTDVGRIDGDGDGSACGLRGCGRRGAVGADHGGAVEWVAVLWQGS